MTGTTAKAHLLELLLEPLKGCKGLYTYRQDLMQKNHVDVRSEGTGVSRLSRANQCSQPTPSVKFGFCEQHDNRYHGIMRKRAHLQCCSIYYWDY